MKGARILSFKFLLGYPGKDLREERENKQCRA